MWKYTDRVYKFQTNDKEVQKKLNKEHNAHLVSIGMGCDLWIYDLLLDGHLEACSILSDLAGAPVHPSTTEGVFCA